jgi:UDP-glucose 4-epimerase
MVKNWLITGGCGFLGTSLIKRILMDDSDAQIIVLDNLTVGSRDDLSEVCSFSECASESIKNKSGVKLIVGDICEPATCNAVSENIDCIVHFAANTGVGPSVEDPRSDMEANVIGTFNMLESARLNGVKHFVFASSGAPAGNVIPPIHEEMAPHPVSPYGASKLAGEGYCSSYYQTFNINTVVLRFGNVYGPGSKNKSSVVAKFIRRASEGKCCEIYGDGTQTRDFIYIDDLIDAVIKASQHDKGGEVFQIAAGTEKTLNELMDVLQPIFEAETGKKMEVKYSDKRLGDVMRNFSDISKANDILGWSVKMKLEGGLRITVKDFM